MSNNPLVSIIAVCYNQEKFIKDSLMSLLAQDYSPLQIIISDDNSTDHTFEIISEITQNYRGPHELIIHKNNKNLGIGGNRNSAIQLATGKFLATADGDDISAPHRISTLVRYWHTLTPRPSLITTDAIDFTVSGEILATKRCDDLQDLPNPESFITHKPLFWGCTNFYSKDLIEKFSGINDGVGADDQVIVLRAMLLDGAHSLHQALVQHRQGGVGSTTAMSARKKGDLLIAKAPIAIADISQMLEDSRKAGKSLEIEQVLKKPIAEANFTKDIANSKSFSETYQIFRKYPDAPFFKKVRIYIYIHLPSINQIYFIFKKNKV
jgi:glycosyltransferase involved in cell wall biosynthesis